MVTENTYYFPWVRKGLSNRITEVDTLGRMQDTASLAKQRPVLSVTSEYEFIPASEQETQADAIPVSETREVRFISPGDITGVNSSALLKMVPKEESSGFPVQFYPYIEFWEADFPWRYTPGRPDGNKLRPWLALLVCEKDRCSMKRLADGRSYVTLIIDNNEQYEQIFPYPEDSWKSAHAQGLTLDNPNLSRLLALRAAPELVPDTDYCVFLVPAFETGRLRGLGYDDDTLKDVVAQASAWEKSLEEQKSKHPKQALDFPVYYSWSFTTGNDSFDGLVEKLKIADGFKSDIKVDVTHMGEGLDYDLFKNKPSRKTIGMPVATQTLGYTKATLFPDPKSEDESDVYHNLKDLISKNPVFLENKSEISGQRSGEPVGDDDPWVTPPAYGGKHIMATSIDEAVNEKEGTPWLTQLNLDIHNRAAAGLGKRTIQIHQEELVNRAWKQIEFVNAINRELHQRLLSVNVNKSLTTKALRPYRSKKGRGVKPGAKSGNAFVAGMMRNFGSMKNARVKDADGKPATSLSAILSDSYIPQSFSSASFQYLTDHMAKLVADLDSATLMQNIADKQIFRVEKHAFHNLPSVEQMRDTTNTIFTIMMEQICGVLSQYFYIAANPTADHADISEENFNKLFRFDPKPVDSRFAGYTITDYYYGDVNCYIPRDGRIKIDSPFDEYKITNYSKYLIPADGQIRNVIMLPEEEYALLFGPGQPVTRVGGWDGIYFVSRRRLKQLWEKQNDSQRAISFYEPVVLEFRSYYTGGGGHSIGWGNEIEIGEVSYNPDTDTLFSKPIHHSYGPSSTTGGSRQVGPCYVMLDAGMAEDLTTKFDTLYSYVEFLKRRSDTSDFFYLNAWVRLDDCVKKMEADKAAREGSESRPPAISAKAADQLQQGFGQQETYELIWQTADGYYAELFANSPSGQALRNTYIDELLRSKYPIMAYPIFPEPAYHYLKMFSEKFILACVDDLPDDSVAIFGSNPEFEEAYLCGMNTEMGRELLWREYPTDQRGSYFRKFWDSETSAADIRNDNFFDVQPLHTWKGNLGDNHLESKTGLLLFTIKGKLMRQYPSTQIYLHKAVRDIIDPKKICFDKTATEENGGIIRPIMQAFLKEDIMLIGFKKEFSELVGNPSKGDYGYCLAFLEDVQDLNFEDDPDLGTANDAAAVADVLKNDPTLFGKHISLFI